eukprot:symbB.v1.2.023102.t2/scaffold2088.1/size89948/7
MVRAPPHRCLEWLEDEASRLMLANQNQDLEELRQEVMERRDVAIMACAVEILVSVASMALYDLRRTILVPVANTVLAVLAAVGLHGALRIRLQQIQVHGVVTTGLLIACLANFLCEELANLLWKVALGSEMQCLIIG